MVEGIITASLAFVGAITGSLLVNKFNYKQLFAQTVSTNRMEWINVWRENISTFISCAEVLHRYQKSNDGFENCVRFEENCKALIEYEHRMYTARAMITSRLNLNEQSHFEIMDVINKFKCDCSDEEFENQREILLCLAREILKPEWERVKLEAKGK